RSARLDPLDPGVGMRRAHEARIRLARHVDVVAIAAAADEQARVFLPQDGLAETLASRAGPRFEKGHGALDRGSPLGRCQGLTVPPFRRIVRASGAFRIGWIARETAMNRSRLFLSGAVLIGLLLLVAAWPTARPAAQPGGAMQIDGDDIGGGGARQNGAGGGGGGSRQGAR